MNAVARQYPTIRAVGASAQAYVFTCHALTANFNPVAAVYVVLRGNDSLYVGQTDNLAERFANHHKSKSFDLFGATRIGVLRVAGLQDRLRIERDLLNSNYTWPCNA